MALLRQEEMLPGSAERLLDPSYCAPRKFITY